MLFPFIHFQAKSLLSAFYVCNFVYLIEAFLRFFKFIASALCFMFVNVSQFWVFFSFCNIRKHLSFAFGEMLQLQLNNIFLCCS